MVRTLVVGALVASVAASLLPACGSDEEPVNPELPLSASTVRDCLRAAGSFPEDVPAGSTNLIKLGALVQRAENARGAVATPPPDPTFSGSVLAHFLLFDGPAAAQGATSAGREAVLEFRERFRLLISSNTDYEMTEVQRNVLVLYLQDPSDAERQKEDIGECIRDAPS